MYVYVRCGGEDFVFFQSLIRTFQCKCQDDWFVISFKLSYTDISEVVFSSKKMIERIIPVWGESGLFVSSKDSFALHQSIFDKIGDGFEVGGKV